MALRAKDELLREGRKRGLSGFTAEGAAEIEKLKKPRSTWVPWTAIQKVYKNERLAMTKCVNSILSYLVMFILENIKLIKDEMMYYLLEYLIETYYYPESSGIPLGYQLAPPSPFWRRGWHSNKYFCMVYQKRSL